MNSEFYEKHLKSFPVPKPLLDHEDVPFMGSLPDMLRLTRKTTGIDIRFIRAGGSLPEDVEAFPVFPVENRRGKIAGHLVVYGIREVGPLGEKEWEAFVAALAELLGDAYHWQWALRANEAGQITDIPISCRVRKEEEISAFLQTQLKNTGKILRCESAALYMLNKDSTLLKLRAIWGLPQEKLLEPARSLRKSLADMESLLGQAVILNDPFLFEIWNPPEVFPSAVCVPVCSDAAVYGTLWFFADRKRDFSTDDLGILEITSGRITSEIEKAALIKEIKFLRG